MNSSNPPSLSVIIVNWNTKKDLEKCLESHFIACKNLSSEVETIVIDNASTDGSADQIRQWSNKEPHFIFIESKENLGFANACNIGLERAKGGHLLLLNPDTLLFSDTYQKTLECISQMENIGIAGIKTKNPDLSLQPSVWNEPNLGLLFLETFYLYYLLSKKIRGKLLLSGYFDHQESREVGMVLGAFFWITRSCYEKIKGLHPDFFLFGEDLEYCMRAKREGFRVYFFHEPSYIHSGNQSTKKLEPKWRVERTIFTLYHVLSLYHNQLWLFGYAILQGVSFGIRWIFTFPRMIFKSLFSLGKTGESGYFKAPNKFYLFPLFKVFFLLLQPGFGKKLEQKVNKKA